MTTPRHGLVLSHLSRTPSLKCGVTDASISVPVGEIYELYGTNGAGKTTLSVYAGRRFAAVGTLYIDVGPLLMNRAASPLGWSYLADNSAFCDSVTSSQWASYIAGI